MQTYPREKIVTKYGNLYKLVVSGNDSVTIYRCPAVSPGMAFDESVTAVVISHPEDALGWGFMPDTQPERYHSFKSVEEALAWCTTRPDKFSPAFGQLGTNMTDAQAKSNVF